MCLTVSQTTGYLLAWPAVPAVFYDYSLCMRTRYTWESQKKKLQHYKQRKPEASPLYQTVFHSHEELQYVWEFRFQHQYGCLRDEVTKTLAEHLNCGILAHGAAMAYCDGFHDDGTQRV